jgi:hypothetical protein
MPSPHSAFLTAFIAFYCSIALVIFKLNLLTCYVYYFLYLFLEHKLQEGTDLGFVHKEVGR